MASRTAALVPANLMKRVGCSAQVRLVALTMLIVRIWLSSRSSMAATSTPALTVAATVLAASYNKFRWVVVRDLDRGERDDGDRSFRRDHGEFDADFCDNTQCAFRSDEQLCQIVPCRRFSHQSYRMAGLIPWPLSRFNDGSIG